MDIFDIALTFTPQVGDQTAKHLIEAFGSAQNLFLASQEEMIHRCNLKPSIARDIAQRTALPKAEEALRYCAKNTIRTIAATDPAYPQLLKRVSSYPHLLYLIGDADILNHNLVSFVGSRKMTSYGERACFKIIERLSILVPNLVIVSGLAYGVDAAAHRAALTLGIPTIAVVPTTLPNVTPSAHHQLAGDIVCSGGALVSEVLTRSSSYKPNFVPRNRIIAGLGAATIVIESSAKGGSLRTAEIATSHGIAVGALPGRITDEMSIGCNRLIASQNAFIVNSAEDIVRELGWCDLKSELGGVEPLAVEQESFDLFDSLSEDQRGLLSCFRSNDPLHIEELGELTQMSAGELTALLMELELFGAVRSLSGSRFERLIQIRRS